MKKKLIKVSKISQKEVRILENLGYTVMIVNKTPENAAIELPRGLMNELEQNVLDFETFLKQRSK